MTSASGGGIVTGSGPGLPGCQALLRGASHEHLAPGYRGRTGRPADYEREDYPPCALLEMCILASSAGRNGPARDVAAGQRGWVAVSPPARPAGSARFGSPVTGLSWASSTVPSRGPGQPGLG